MQLSRLGCCRLNIILTNSQKESNQDLPTEQVEPTPEEVDQEPQGTHHSTDILNDIQNDLHTHEVEPTAAEMGQDPQVERPAHYSTDILTDIPNIFLCPPRPMYGNQTNV